VASRQLEKRVQIVAGNKFSVKDLRMSHDSKDIFVLIGLCVVAGFAGIAITLG